MQVGNAGGAGRVPHDTGQLVQRGALPSWHVRGGDAQAAQPGSQVWQASRSTAPSARRHGAGRRRRRRASGLRFGPGRLLDGTCSRRSLSSSGRLRAHCGHVVIATAGRARGLAALRWHGLMLGDTWFLRGDSLRSRTGGSTWNGGAVAFALACQRRLRLRQDLVERLGRDRQWSQGHLIRSGFDQPGEVVLGPDRGVLAHDTRDGTDRRRCGDIFRRSIGSGSLIESASLRAGLRPRRPAPGCLGTRGWREPGDENLLCEEPAHPAAPRLPATESPGIPERCPGAGDRLLGRAALELRRPARGRHPSASIGSLCNHRLIGHAADGVEGHRRPDLSRADDSETWEARLEQSPES